MTQTTSAAERFTLALGEYVRAEIAYQTSDQDEYWSRHLLTTRDHTAARLEDAFNEAVDVRVQEALTYANRSDEY